jgi:hypothetical protein
MSAKRDFSDVMKETLAAMAPGLKNIGPQVGAELSRLGTQGAAEMAQALFNGAAFTPYGQGQIPATADLGKESQEQEIQKAELHPEPEQERGGMEM